MTMGLKLAHCLNTEISLTLRWPSLAHNYIPKLGDPQEVQFVIVVV